jgi:hypothetical protein
MSKLKLELDTLHVETFEVAIDGDERGTVHARATPVTACPVSQCYSCDPLCEMTSFPSCPDTNCCEFGSELCEPLTSADGCAG